MRGIPGIFCVAGVLAASVAQAVEPSHLQCFNPRQVVDFQRLSDTRMIVRTMRTAYELKLGGACFDPTARPIIRFEAAGPGGMICGALGDYVIFSAQDRCRIMESSPITRAQYDALQNSATDPK